MVGSMFIRRTQTRRTEDGKSYFSHRLVHAERLGSSVRQRTLLNLGRHFDIPQADWPLLCARINDALSGQAPLVADCPPAVEEEAQRIAAQLIARGAAAPTAGPTDVQPVDVDSLRLVRPRSVGVEQVGLWALEQLDLPALLTRLGVNGALRSAATGAIVGRLAAPASERATHRWLQERSGLGELLGVDFETVGAMQLYRASDVLVKHREEIEEHLFDRAMGLFDLQPTVTLYDLTNTYFEGEASDQPQAQRGHSKEKRSDCPLLTLGLMLDASGFVRRSKVFAGNVREHRTLAGMLEALEAPVGALVVMDRGVATDACVTWLRDNGYRYLVVSRERHRRFDADAAVSLQTQSDQTVHMHKVVSTDPDEVRLYCYSEERANKERGIVERFAARFETALTKLNDGLARPRAHKRLDQVWQRIGRLKAKHSRVASHYQISVTANEAGDQAVAVTWTRRPQDGSMVTHPGVYCLRSSETDWDEDALWRTYTTLTDVEAVFRSLKSELGLRPIYHRKPARADGHLFITVIAYQLVQVIRTRLRAHGEHAKWTTSREDTLLEETLYEENLLPVCSPSLPSMDGSKPAICGRLKTGHFRRPETGVEIYFTASSVGKVFAGALALAVTPEASGQLDSLQYRQIQIADLLEQLRGRGPGRRFRQRVPPLPVLFLQLQERLHGVVPLLWPRSPVRWPTVPDPGFAGLAPLPVTCLPLGVGQRHTAMLHRYVTDQRGAVGRAIEAQAWRHPPLGCHRHRCTRAGWSATACAR